MNRSLRVSLTSLLIALSLVPALAISAALGWGIFERERAHVIQLERQVTDQAADQIVTYVAGAEAELYALIQDPALRGADQAAREAVLSEALFYRDTFDALALVERGGAEPARVSRIGVVAPEDLQDHDADPIFREPMRTNKTYYQGFSTSTLTGEPLLWMSVPMLNVQTGSPDGVLIASVRMRQVFDRVTSLALGKSGTLMITDADSQLIAHPNLAALADVASPRISADGAGAGITGEQVLQIHRRLTIGNLSLTISAEQPLAEADESMRRSLATAALLLVGILALAVIFALVSVGRIARPIRELADATQRISAGDTSGQVAVTRRDEIGTLQGNFNQMVADLRAQRKAIGEHTSALQSSLDRQHDLLETVAQLSSPLLPVWEGVVVLPIIGHVDAQRGETLTSGLLAGVAQRGAQVAILDITGLATVNDETISTLLRAAQAVELLGSHAMLAGVSAPCAQRIVASHISLGKLESYRDLQSAVECAINRHNGHGAQTPL